MNAKDVAFHAEAIDDLLQAWHLVCRNDGSERADRLVRRIETFCFRLGQMPMIGTARDNVAPGLRTVGVLGLSTVTVAFQVQAERLLVVRIGYLGRDVLADLRLIDSEEQGRTGTPLLG